MAINPVFAAAIDILTGIKEQEEELNGLLSTQDPMPTDYMSALTEDILSRCSILSGEIELISQSEIINQLEIMNERLAEIKDALPGMGGMP